MLNENLNILSTLELLKSLRTIVREWNYKTPFKRWCYLYSFARATLKIIGIPLFQDDLKIYWYSYCTYVFVGIYYVAASYTCLQYIMRGEPTKCLPCTCLIGIITCYIPFAWSTLSEDRYKYQALIDFSGRYIYPDSNKNIEYNRMCSQQINETMKKCMLKLMMMSIGGSGGFILSIYAYLAHGIKSTTIEVKIPFTGEKSNIEFTINMIFQFIIFFHGFFIYMGMEIMMNIFGDVARFSPVLIRSRLKQLDGLNESGELSEAQTHHTFKDIVTQAHDCDNFVESVKECLSLRTLVTPILFTYSIAMAIYCQFSMGFVAGYGMALMSWVQLYFMCETGQDIQDNGIVEILYDFDWYNLPLKLQKDLRHMIHRAQNPRCLSVGPFGAVNRDLFKVVTKKVYTLVMFLLNLNN